MQRKYPLPAPQATDRAPQLPKGPTPIDPRDFKLVAGGAPKGGWGTSCAPTTPMAPKGGW